MFRRTLTTLALAAGLTASAGPLAAPSFANDASFGGEGSELIPLKETRIMMASEDIVMELKKGLWEVKATYQFRNPTEHTIPLQLGFPEKHCDPDESDCVSSRRGRFQRMKTMVRGKKVAQRTGEVAPNTPWAPQLGRVFLYDITFAPKETVEVVHEYAYDMNQGVGGAWVDYVTKTGTLWNGPIGKARFTLRMPERPWDVGYLPGYSLDTYQTKMVGRKPVTELTFQMASWTPTNNLMVEFPTPGDTWSRRGLEDCPLLRPFEQRDAREIKAARKQLEKLTDARLRVCRNIPYAHHGYEFKDSSLRAIFYRGRIPSEQFDEPTRLGFAYNPGFDAKMLTRAEHRYIAAIKREEKSRAKLKLKAVKKP